MAGAPFYLFIGVKRNDVSVGIVSTKHSVHVATVQITLYLLILQQLDGVDHKIGYIEKGSKELAHVKRPLAMAQ